MASTHRNTTLRGKIELDGSTFENVNFEAAELVYKGGLPPRMLDCGFGKGVSFTFEGPAGNTLAFLKQMAGSGNWSNFVKGMLGIR